MRLTPEQESKTRLFSDTDLYHKAITLSNQHPPVASSQMAGLLEYSRTWKELIKFVKHQRDDRDWGEPGKSKKAHYKGFYVALHVQLDRLRRAVKDDYVSNDLTRAQTREQVDFFASLLAREFIQHLAAEMMWKEANLS